LATFGTADKIFSHNISYYIKHGKVNEVKLMFCIELLITIYCAANVHPKGCCQVAAPQNQNKKKVHRHNVIKSFT
jgi:hypothetical protein